MVVKKALKLQEIKVSFISYFIFPQSHDFYLKLNIFAGHRPEESACQIQIQLGKR